MLALTSPRSGLDRAHGAGGDRAADRRRTLRAQACRAPRRTGIADTSGLAGETLNAIQTVQAFTLEGLQSERFATARVERAFATPCAAPRRARCSPRRRDAGVRAITLVLWLGAHAVLAGEMTGGELGQFLLYAGSSWRRLGGRRSARCGARCSAPPAPPSG
jgi:ABC-type multidrug transport system fused ATPase/permease subunit